MVPRYNQTQFITICNSYDESRSALRFEYVMRQMNTRHVGQAHGATYQFLMTSSVSVGGEVVPKFTGELES